MSSQSTELRNKCQLYSVSLKKRRESKPNGAGEVGDDLSSLLRYLKSMDVVKIIIVKKRCYIFNLSMERQVEEVVKFCCTDQNISVLGIDTRYNLCNIWVTDLCYQNKRIIG